MQQLLCRAAAAAAGCRLESKINKRLLAWVMSGTRSRLGNLTRQSNPSFILPTPLFLFSPSVFCKQLSPT